MTCPSHKIDALQRPYIKVLRDNMLRKQAKKERFFLLNKKKGKMKKKEYGRQRKTRPTTTNLGQIRKVGSETT